MSRMRVHTIWVATAFLVCCCSLGQGTTIHVPGDHPTIQAGIDAASPGDTVLVASGVYIGVGNRDIDFGGKDLALMSESGSGGTVIDCEGSDTDPHRAFCFNGATAATAVIRGFTMRNGYADDKGGGIYCLDTALSLADCVVTDCEANTVWNGVVDSSGGGMYCTDCALTVEDCAFIQDACGWPDADRGGGGGACCANCSGVFRGCTFNGNRAPACGGGLYSDETSSLTFRSCVFSGNRAGDGLYGWGGGFSGWGVFENVIFSGNRADGYGGGGGVCGGGTFRNVAFTGNAARRGPGGLAGWGDLEVTDCTFTGNGADYGPGAIACSGGTFEQVVVSGSWGVDEGGAAISCSGHPTFSNVTVANNHHEGGAGASGVLCFGSPVFNRVIIALGTGWGPGDKTVAVACGDSAHPTFECCDIYGNSGGEWVGCIADQYGLNGNISEDPLFCGPSTGDFTVAENSPCIPANNGCGVLIGALGAGCSPPSVEATSWGAIKAMFR
jgi:hypothetical protein